MIIAVCGKKGHGKDTFSDYLCENYNFIKLNFADPLKQACKHIFDLTDEQIYGNKKEIVDEFWNTTPREIMQYVGTDLLRHKLKEKFSNIGDNIWVLLMEKKITDILQKNPSQNIIISDLRFLNESKLIKKFGGIIFKISRLKTNDIIGINHLSELEVDILTYDYLIENNSTLDSLYQKINNIISTI